MATLSVPGTYATVTAAMNAANTGDEIVLAAGYGPETVIVTVSGLTISGPNTPSAINLTVGAKIIVSDAGATIDTIVALDGNNYIDAGGGSDAITVGTGDNFIDAGEGINTIAVGATGTGDNIILAGDGADTITVGTGDNFIDAGEGINTIAVGATGTGDNIILAGDGADTITVGMGNNAIDAGGGANIINVGVAGSGNNIILAGDGADIITTGDGDDFICAGGGANIIAAGAGNNTILAGDAADVITATGGDNVIEAGGGANIITSADGNDIIVTGNAADVITTGDGDDIISDTGGLGAITAGLGHDRIIMDFSASAAPLTSSLAVDGGAIGGTVFLGVDEFHITGGSGADSIITGDGADVLDGGAGADTLTAGEGSDVIYGTAGDVITGGEDGDGLDNDVLVLDGLSAGAFAFSGGGSEDGTFTFSGGGSVSFTGIESFVDAADASPITTLEDTSLNGDLGLAAGVTVTTFDVGNITATAGTIVDRTEGDLQINSDGSYTFTPAPNYNGPAPVINYTTLDPAAININPLAGPLSDGIETTPLFIEVTADDEDCIIPPVCFVRGTLIATSDGEIAVEDLKVGDLVQTRDRGLQALRWTGRRDISARDLAENENMRPIRIRKDVINAGNDFGDLVVSPQHRVLVSSKVAQRMFGDTEVLISAKQLLAIDGVDIADDFEDVTYFHILFDQHEIVYADGIPSESLYLGKEAQKSLSAEGREEIHALFPETASPSFMATSCRPIIQGKRAQKLALRHQNNDKHLMMDDQRP